MLRGQWAGRYAIISPSLHGELLTHVEGALFDLQKARTHYAKAAVSIRAERLSVLEELKEEVHAPGGGRGGRER